MRHQSFVSSLSLSMIALLVIFSVSKGCSRPDHARKVLEDQGYTEIRITGWRPFMAGEKESYSTGFEAISPSGKEVSGAVTGGLFKGSTIRFD